MRVDEDEQLEETYRLAKENNRMLRAMRRNAFIGGIIKLVVWAALIGLPIWFYLEFVHPVLQSSIETINQVQDTSAQVGEQFGGFSELLEQVENIPGFGQFNQGE